MVKKIIDNIKKNYKLTLEKQMHFVDGLSQTEYVYDNFHSLLNYDGNKGKKSNIGINGENLTISFLSLNRATLSIKLLESITEFIPNFLGEILIIDNGSIDSELLFFKEAISKMNLKIKLVELGKNFGVSGGRNRTIPHVETQWLMCLDNDIYFINNPLPTIQHDISLLGCHFMNLPLLNPDKETIFARGGHLYVTYYDGELHAGAGSATKQEKIQHFYGKPFLSTFLFGGACVFNKHTFEILGGYDESMFIGFEDIDFSIRLFQAGHKIGNTVNCSLIHDHPLPSSDEDRDYEKERFSRNILHQSALHFEKKHGFKVWSDAVDKWLITRQQELGLNVEETIEFNQNDNSHKNKIEKLKIALVIDTQGWAFSNIAKQIVKHNSEKFDFIIIPMDIIDNITQIFLLAKDASIIHFFWREHLNLIGTEYNRSYVESLGIDYNEFDSSYILNKKITTSIYDHLLLEPSEISERAGLYNNLISGYTVGSKKLYDIYSEFDSYPIPTKIIEDGVDLELFKPKNLDRFKSVKERKIVVGWVGNSKWASELEDFKGLNSILKPAIDELIEEGYPIKYFFADRQERFIPHSEMPDYYNKIDIYVCPSKIEGTPNPVLESMACGVPIISTDVGIVPQSFGDKQKKYILKERSINAVKSAIIELISNPEEFEALSLENLKQIEDWKWSIKAKRFGDFFDSVLSESIDNE